MPATLYSDDAAETISTSDFESGYVSGNSSQASSPEIRFTNSHLIFLNRQLQNLEPQGTVFSVHRNFPEIVLIEWDDRDITMVHHHYPLSISDDIIWSYWARNSGYAFEDENHQASDGRYYIP